VNWQTYHLYWRVSVELIEDLLALYLPTFSSGSPLRLAVLARHGGFDGVGRPVPSRVAALVLPGLAAVRPTDLLQIVNELLVACEVAKRK